MVYTVEKIYGAVFCLLDKRINCNGRTTFFDNGGRFLSKDRQTCIYYDGGTRFQYDRGVKKTVVSDSHYLFLVFWKLQLKVSAL